MKQFTSVNDPEIVRLLRAGGIGVLRTDTLYGVVAAADNETAVQKVYELKGRDEHKSPIVLISDKAQLWDEISTPTESMLADVWPGPVSVIIPSVIAPSWIRRDNDSVAYRLPDDTKLRQLIEQTGPLIAPSANPQGQPPAMTIEEAENYFGDNVDFYVDGGEVLDDTPSRLFRITDDGVEQLR